MPEVQETPMRAIWELIVSFFRPKEQEPEARNHNFVNTYEVEGGDGRPRYKKEQIGARHDTYALRYCKTCNEFFWLYLSSKYILVGKVKDDLRTEEA